MMQTIDADVGVAVDFALTSQVALGSCRCKSQRYHGQRQLSATTVGVLAFHFMEVTSVFRFFKKRVVLGQKKIHIKSLFFTYDMRPFFIYFRSFSGSSTQARAIQL
jgi:hypothetical protein